MKKLLLSLTTLILFNFQSNSQDWKTKLDSALTTMSQQGTFDGQVLLGESGKIVFHKSYGEQEDHKNTPPISNVTPFKVYSVGKSFTANAILLLVQDGKLSLDDKLIEFFPELPYSDIEIRHLLTMTSGLPRFLPVAIEHSDTTKILNNENLIKLISKHSPDSGHPGENFFYNNANYYLLASIVEKVSGKNFESFLNERILNPLQMNHTFDGTDKEIKRIKKEGINADNFIQAYGAGSIFTTVHDLYLYDQGLKNNEILNQDLQSQAYEMTKLKNDSISNYGFGWRINNDEKYGLTVSHIGDGINMWAGIQRFLKADKTMIIIHAFSNEYHQQVYQAIRNIWEGQNFEMPLKRERYDIDPKLFEKYVGTYKSTMFGKVHVSSENGKLYLRPDPIPGKEELVPASDTIFYFKNQNLEWQFYLNDDQKVKGFGLKGDPNMMGLKIESPKN